MTVEVRFDPEQDMVAVSFAYPAPGADRSALRTTLRMCRREALRLAWACTRATLYRTKPATREEPTVTPEPEPDPYAKGHPLADRLAREMYAADYAGTGDPNEPAWPDDPVWDEAAPELRDEYRHYAVLALHVIDHPAEGTVSPYVHRQADAAAKGALQDMALKVGTGGRNYWTAAQVAQELNEAADRYRP